MSVSLSQWAATVLAHPLQYTFEGLSRPASNCQEAVVASGELPALCEQYLESVAASARADADGLAAWLAEDGREFEDEDDARDCYVEQAVRSEAMSIEDGDYDTVWAWAIGDGGGLLSRYPPTGVWSHAFKRGIPFRNVYFICPSCGHEPAPFCAMRFYCGLCGAESLVDTGEDMEDFFSRMGIRRYAMEALTPGEFFDRIVSKGAGRDEGFAAEFLSEPTLVDRGGGEKWVVGIHRGHTWSVYAGTRFDP